MFSFKGFEVEGSWAGVPQALKPNPLRVWDSKPGFQGLVVQLFVPISHFSRGSRFRVLRSDFLTLCSCVS